MEAGFDRAAVASLEPSAYREPFERWLAEGLHAGMGYLERHAGRRFDPRKMLEGARSVLVVALQYASPAAQGETAGALGDLWPRVARYARGVDYHELMGQRLTALAARIEEGFPGAGSRWYVDTGPVLERELAERAGLGVFGKNTNLLHPEAGSWFLLGELFLTLELAPRNEPLADLCGSCSRCLEACPTGALPEPYRLDANRCLSYWTIEHRGPLPLEMRPAIDDWVFGCDICQEVCPYNQQDGTGRAPEAFSVPQVRRSLDLVGLLALDRTAYLELFRGSSMKRARLDGLRRNAAVALGNRRRAEDVAPLVEALTDADALVRRHAAWALGRIGGDAARRGLFEALRGERDDAVSDEIRGALVDAGADAGAPDRAER
jgi:epoxyqueuosine reductase